MQLDTDEYKLAHWSLWFIFLYLLYIYSYILLLKIIFLSVYGPIQNRSINVLRNSQLRAKNKTLRVKNDFFLSFLYNRKSLQLHCRQNSNNYSILNDLIVCMFNYSISQLEVTSSYTLHIIPKAKTYLFIYTRVLSGLSSSTLRQLFQLRQYTCTWYYIGVKTQRNSTAELV